MATLTATHVLTGTADNTSWFTIHAAEDAYGLDAGDHSFGITGDGTILDADGCPLDYNEALERAVRRAIETAA